MGAQIVNAIWTLIPVGVVALVVLTYVDVRLLRKEIKKLNETFGGKWEDG